MSERGAGQRLLDKLKDKDAMLDIADRAAKRQERSMRPTQRRRDYMERKVGLQPRIYRAAAYRPQTRKARFWRWVLGG